MKSSNRDDGWLTGRLYFNREDKRVIIKRPKAGCRIPNTYAPCFPSVVIFP